MTSPPHPLWLRAQTPLRQTHAATVAREWLDSGAWCLVLLGDVGRGKSQAAAWLWDRLRDEDVAWAQRPGVAIPRGGVEWLRPRELERLDWPERSRLLTACEGAYGLVVDELGAEGDKTVPALMDVLESRGDSLRRTVITSNMPADEFSARYRARLVSRLRSTGLSANGLPRWVVYVGGPDLRGRVELAHEYLGEWVQDEEPVTPEQREEILADYPEPVVRMIKGDR